VIDYDLVQNWDLLLAVLNLWILLQELFIL
jgi:hypothetical protein